MEWLKPTKKSMIVFAILAIVYIAYLLFFSLCTMAFIRCIDKPHHDVLPQFPGSSSCQICATNSELFWGYVLMIGLYYVLPLIAFYLLSSMLNLKKKA
jgi:hypothetical protein